MINRILDYMQWVRREYLEEGTTVDIYDNLGGKHDVIVDYSARVAAVKKALQVPSKRFRSILDIACGTGAVLDAIPDKKDSKIVGIDFSNEMLSVAKKRLHVYRNIRFKQVDFMSAVFRPSSFDLIIIANSIRFVPKGQEEIFAKKIARWLKSGGMFIAIELTYPFMDQSDWILSLIGLPKGQNRWINNSQNFIPLMSRFLTFENQKVVATQDLFHKTIAMYFTKS